MVTSAVCMQGICKSFHGVPVLRNVNLEIRQGEVHGLVGENGAGKSTLIKILAGIYARDAGQIEVSGKPVQIRSAQDAQALGLSFIHQELAQVPFFDAIDNMFLGASPPQRWRMLNRSAMRAAAEAKVRELDLDFDLGLPVVELSIGQRWMVAVARALLLEARVIIMDEPTGALSLAEVEQLFSIIRQLQQRGVAILYVSHRMEEIFELTRRVTVMKDGAVVGTVNTTEVDRSALVQMMVGHTVDNAPKAPANGRGARVLSVRNLSSRGVFADVTFDLHAGEVVGVAGLVGAGRTEVARAIFGADRYDSGEIALNGRPVKPGSVRDAITAGVVMVPEDRKTQGLVGGFTVRNNITLANLRRFLTLGALMDERRETENARRYIHQLSIRATGVDVPVETLSGGNQQKVVLAKWMDVEPKALIMDEPTRGMDVGAREDVYALMRELAAAGTAVMMISSDLEEILAQADRTLVMRQGRIVGELSREQMSKEAILQLCFDVKRGLQDAAI